MVAARPDEQDEDDVAEKEVEKKETAQKAHPRRRYYDEEAEDGGNRGDGWVVGLDPASTTPTSQERGQKSETPPETVETMGGETTQEAPNEETGTGKWAVLKRRRQENEEKELVARLPPPPDEGHTRQWE